MSRTALPDDVTEESVLAELRGDIDFEGDMEHVLRNGTDHAAVVMVWAAELRQRFPDLSALEAFHVAVIFYFG